MSQTIVIVVQGEVLAEGQEVRITDQRRNAQYLSAALLPLFPSDLNKEILG